MLIATNEIYLWGEPFHATHRLQQLREAQSDLDAYAATAPIDPLAVLSEFRPALQAPPGRWLEATRMLLHTVYAPPDGTPSKRWGLKDVHIEPADLDWWRRLFPGAAVIILVRDPVAAYSSYASSLRGRLGSGWMQPPPWGAITSPSAWSALWLARIIGLKDWVETHGGLMLRYEDAVANPNAALHSVFEFIGLPLLADEQVNHAIATAALRLGEAARHSWPALPDDIDVVQQLCSPVAATFGYDCRS